ncbi:MAG TPA: FAD-dependent oxidoreductase, partial [bacterium]|nr:FAD-dependent oxidoreductase [bacterium]
ILARREPPIVRGVENQRRDRAEVSPYQIPFRSLYSRDIRNLLLAGRNISATHVALSSTRVMGTCGLLGQASGTAAWLCRKHRLEPREIHSARTQELQQALLRDGVFIPGVVNEDKGDLLRGARVTASSQAPLALPPSDGEWELDRPRGQVLPLAGRVGRLAIPLRTKVPARLEFRLERLSDFWDRSGGKLVCEAGDLPVSPRDRCLSVALERELEPGFYRFSLAPAAGVFLKKVLAPLPALYAAERPGAAWRPCPLFQVDFRLAPDIYPFGPGNTVSGVNRPEKWTNLWISDPAAGLPQRLEWEPARPAPIGYLQFFFEAALDLEYKQCPPFFVPAGIPSRYRVSLLDGNRWKRVVEVKSNTEYLRRHDFAPRPAGKVRLEILEVNGGRSAVVTEARGYRRIPD